MPHSRRVEKRGSSSYTIEDIIRDIKALNSSVLLLSQKMNYLVRNEKILGRNFIILNKKLKSVQQRKPSSVSASGELSPELRDLVSELEEQVKSNSFLLKELKADLSKTASVYAKQEDLMELKYVIEAINPLEFATLEQVKDLIAGKTSKSLKKPKKKK